MDDFFTDTLMGLLQAIEIKDGHIPVDKVQNVPADTYRVRESDAFSASKKQMA